ncbi:hypothetical protein [Thermoflavimicrobium dichotomicum]|uniref:Uncharacterized protein n=1 Tax=Thermoflavimicrobium dichotomicum TaxID=46223 RepID=A0A1I3VDM5_9BACL|nr:hypothetical protein [Thermoflavimicrobium dichotomicum]SFJ92307.1 hypothetical protein SAMN05421852_1406 [Thermoflavimicrobium dichotomicum]
MPYYGSNEVAFLLGLRKSVWLTPGYSLFDEIANKYPFISKREFPALKGGIFFQNEEIKKELCKNHLKDAENIEFGSSKFHYTIGHLLGYPPKAIHFFVHLITNSNLNIKRVGIDYCGVTCAGSIDDLLDDATWLWQEYPFPEWDILKIQYQDKKIYIPYQDFETLQEVQKKLKAATDNLQILNFSNRINF